MNLFLLTVHNESGDIIFTAEASTADDMIAEVGRAERMIERRKAEASRVVPEENPCYHQCSGNCRRVGCNCECGEWHKQKET